MTSDLLIPLSSHDCRIAAHESTFTHLQHMLQVDCKNLPPLQALCWHHSLGAPGAAHALLCVALQVRTQQI